MSKCAACVEMGKPWQGSDPKCSFDSGVFSRDGWNCATAGLIRDVVCEGGTPHAAVDYRYCDDQKYATVQIDDLDLDGQPLALWVAWYKNRGGTDAMWLLFDDQPPRAPTEAECLLIAAARKRA